MRLKNVSEKEVIFDMVILSPGQFLEADDNFCDRLIRKYPIQIKRVDEVEPIKIFSSVPVESKEIEKGENLACEFCGKLCKSSAGLKSHIRGCKKKV